MEEQPVSYTHRTDKLLDAICNDHGFVNQQNCPKQWVGFAIELETELQEATFEIERLKKSNLQLREGAEEQNQRIKRLEAAGDELEADKQTLLGLLHQMGAKPERLGGVGVGSANRWINCKEAKP